MDGRGGRKVIEIDLEKVKHLAGDGLNEFQICDVLGICWRTLYRRKRANVSFVNAIQEGRSKAAGVIANRLYEKAKTGDLGAIIWYEKTRQGRTDRTEITSVIRKLDDETILRLLDIAGGGESEGAERVLW